jgi:hypothetical protein
MFWFFLFIIVELLWINVVLPIFWLGLELKFELGKWIIGSEDSLFGRVVRLIGGDEGFKDKLFPSITFWIGNEGICWTFDLLYLELNLSLDFIISIF